MLTTRVLTVLLAMTAFAALALACSIESRAEASAGLALTPTLAPVATDVPVEEPADKRTAVDSAAEVADAADIVRAPTDLPAPLGERGPADVEFTLEAVEVTGRLSDGTT